MIVAVVVVVYELKWNFKVPLDVLCIANEIHRSVIHLPVLHVAMFSRVNNHQFAHSQNNGIYSMGCVPCSFHSNVQCQQEKEKWSVRERGRIALERELSQRRNGHLRPNGGISQRTVASSVGFREPFGVEDVVVCCPLKRSSVKLSFRTVEQDHCSSRSSPSPAPATSSRSAKVCVCLVTRNILFEWNRVPLYRVSSVAAISVVVVVVYVAYVAYIVRRAALPSVSWSFCVFVLSFAN